MKKGIKKIFDFKKFLLFILTLFGSLFLYFLIPFTGDEFFGIHSAIHFGVITIIFVLIHTLLIWYFFYKKRKAINIIIVAFFILIHSTMLLIPIEFPKCYSYGLYWQKKICSCLGIKRHFIFGSECIGHAKFF